MNRSYQKASRQRSQARLLAATRVCDFIKELFPSLRRVASEHFEAVAPHQLTRFRTTLDALQQQATELLGRTDDEDDEGEQGQLIAVGVGSGGGGSGVGAGNAAGDGLDESLIDLLDEFPEDGVLSDA
eukprot:m.94140 g.94140  ORF g.94140 m.94140 type:complete len:128 (-) comp13842_c4_seq1:18-401(-)